MSTQGYWSNINNIIVLRYLWYRFPRKLLADCRTTFGRHSPHSCLTAGQYSANSQKQTCVKFFTSCGPTELYGSSCSLLSKRGQLKLKTEKVHTFTSRKKSKHEKQCFITRKSNTEKRIDAQWSIFDNFEVFECVMKHYVKCFRWLLTQSDFRRRNKSCQKEYTLVQPLIKQLTSFAFCLWIID